MNRIRLAGSALALFLAPLAAADEPGAKARELAEKVTAEGAALFDKLDPRAMAETYDEKAVLTVIDKEDGAVRRESRQGRGPIEEAYKGLFEKAETIRSRNKVEYARFLSPDVLAIDGVFDSNTLKADSVKVPFHQVRCKKDGKWLILSMEISLLPQD